MPTSLPEGFTLIEPEQPKLTTLPEGFKLVKDRKDQNFFERFGDDLKNRFGVQGKEIIRATLDREQSTHEALLQVVGKVGAGTVMDFLGEALVSGGRGLSNITPDAIEDPIKGGASYVAHKLLDTKAGQAGLEKAKEGVVAYQEWAEENPVMARNVESVVNIGFLATPLKAKSKPTTPGALSRAGQAVERSGNKAAVQKRRDFIRELVLPEQNKRTRVEQAGRTGEVGKGILKRKEVQLSPQQAASFNAALRVPGLSPKKTMQGNYNVLQKAVSQEADKLQKGLANLKGNRVFDYDEYLKELDAVKGGLKKSALVGDAEKVALRVIEKMEELVPQAGVTLDKLLVARKNLDKWIVKQKPKAFDPSTSNALSIAVQEIRQATNNFIAQRAKGVGVRRSLDKQFNLLRAMDDIAVKAANEGDTAIRRAFQKVLKVLPLRSEFNNAAALMFGVGGLGAAAMFAPIFTRLAAATGAVYIGGKAIMSPFTRKGLGKLLKWTDEAMKKVTDPAVLHEMRVDRALIVEMMKNAETEE